MKSAINAEELAMHSTFQAMDADKSGSVQPEEMRSFLTRLFPAQHENHEFHKDQINVLALKSIRMVMEMCLRKSFTILMPIIVEEESASGPEESARRMFAILSSFEEGDESDDSEPASDNEKFKDMLELFGLTMSFEELGALP